jgi:hypothetical protein
MKAIGTVHLALFWRRYSILHLVARTGEQIPVPLSPLAIFLFQIPFFSMVKVYATDVDSYDNGDGIFFHSLQREVFSLIVSDLPLDMNNDVAVDNFSEIRGP